MKEYCDLVHLSRKEKMNHDETYYLLPHNGLIKENSTTTRLRVVFDASCATDNGMSFNDILLVGPTIQVELTNIILRFRQYPIVMCADVKKMYRMLRVNEKYQLLQSTYWRVDSGDEIELFQPNSVTYGTSAAPFLAVRCLKQLPQE